MPSDEWIKTRFDQLARQYERLEEKVDAIAELQAALNLRLTVMETKWTFVLGLGVIVASVLPSLWTWIAARLRVVGMFDPGAAFGLW